MKKSKFLFFILLSIAFSLLSFNLPKSIKKKIDKEIKLVFEIEEFQLEPIEVSEGINAQLQTKISGKNLYRISHQNTILGYAFIDKAPSKTAQFDYLVLFDTDLIITKTKVLVYREDYGGEIGSKRWLNQFVGKTKEDKITYEKDIIAISGATISANSMTVAVNNLLKTMETLYQNKIF